MSADDLEDATQNSKKPLNNGNKSPGVRTYQERRKELSIDNTAAFRTIRRLPAPPGETFVRLGNAYEFFKNLEMFSGYWHDTSLPIDEDVDMSDSPKEDDSSPAIPNHLKTHVRIGTGPQLPPEYRQYLLTAFLKLVAYDFNCTVAFPRCEPRLFLTPPASAPSSAPPSYFNSSATFIYRTPTDRISARTGVVEGPVAALSCRTTTAFTTPLDSNLDFAREMVALLLTAQQRARDGKTEVRAGHDKWWTTRPRWGGGKGGPIGREADFPSPSTSLSPSLPRSEPANTPSPTPAAPPPKRKKGISADGSMAIYSAYRRLAPPPSTWDRKTRYEAIGKVAGAAWDDVFLVSALNHHVCVLRARVPGRLLEVLGGAEEGEGCGKDGEEDEGEKGCEWGKVEVWRSRWFDLFRGEDRVEGMELIWGMMAWVMRGEEPPEEKEEKEENDGAEDRMGE